MARYHSARCSVCGTRHFPQHFAQTCCFQEKLARRTPRPPIDYWLTSSGHARHVTAWLCAYLVLGWLEMRECEWEELLDRLLDDGHTEIANNFLTQLGWKLG